MTADQVSSERARLLDLDARPGSAGEELRYGDHPDQIVEVHGDPGSARRAIIVVHGGYFRARFDRSHVRPLARELSSRGALVHLVEYRRVGGGGGHPHTAADIDAGIARALADLAERAPELPLTVTGHSAGGCLVMGWASRQPAEGAPVALIPLAPITDLVREAVERLADGAVEDYLGVHPSADLRPYLTEDPRSRVALIPERFALQNIHGAADTIVDIRFSREFPAALLELPGAHHADVVDPESPHAETVMAALLG